MRVAILGGTGKFGRALATRLEEAGDDVVIGSRDAERAREIAEKLGVRGARNDDVGDVDLVVLAVEAGSALTTLRSLTLTAPLLSVAAEVEFDGGTARPPGHMPSLAERIAEIAGLMESALGQPTSIVATGGAMVKSAAWRGMLEHALGRPVAASRVRESSLRGAAQLAVEHLET